jgi:hypothetical protein
VELGHVWNITTTAFFAKMNTRTERDQRSGQRGILSTLNVKLQPLARMQLACWPEGKYTVVLVFSVATPDKTSIITTIFLGL